MKIGCVVGNGEIRDSARAEARIRGFDFVIAADGGADFLRVRGMKPHVIIGDMDSLNPDIIQNASGIEVIRFPRDKDKSDVELAVDLAFERGCGIVSLFGALGGRLDHTLGNVSLAVRNPGRIKIVSECSTLTAVEGPDKFVLEAGIGAVVSMIPFPRAEKVTTSGLKYPLENEILFAGTRGISNVLLERRGWIRVGSGLLLVDVEDREPE